MSVLLYNKQWESQLHFLVCMIFFQEVGNLRHLKFPVIFIVFFYKYVYYEKVQNVNKVTEKKILCNPSVQK